MRYFWEKIIEPALKIKGAKLIVEVGAENGFTTENILRYCVENDARLICIDPFPQFDVDELNSKYQGRMTFYRELSLSVLGLIGGYDAILMDGDHNWYTVYNELKLIERSFKGQDNFPLIFMHDTSWPYARRDMYYNPDNIPETYLQPYMKKGMKPSQSSLMEFGGFNSDLNNSIYANNLRNGVLTALEDFLNETDRELSKSSYNIFYGLSVIFVEDTKLSNFLNSRKLLEEVVGLTEAGRLDVSVHSSNLMLINASVKSELERAKEGNASLKADFDEVIANNASLSAEIVSIKASNDSLSAENASIKADNDSLSAEIVSIKASNDSLSTENALFNTEIASFKANVKSLNTEIDSYKAINDSLMVENHFLHERIAYFANSSSWKITKPFRFALRLLHRVFKKQ